VLVAVPWVPAEFWTSKRARFVWPLTSAVPSVHDGSPMTVKEVPRSSFDGLNQASTANGPVCVRPPPDGMLTVPPETAVSPSPRSAPSTDWIPVL